MSFPELFVTDLDSTALGGGHRPYARFPNFFSRFLDRLDSGGCRWAINTTWDVKSQWELVLGSSVKSRPLYLMGGMGNQLARLENGEPAFVEPFTKNTREKIREFNYSKLYPLLKDIFSRFSPETAHFFGDSFSFTVIVPQKEEFVKYISENCSSDSSLFFELKNNTVAAYPAFMEKSRSLEEVLRITRIKPGKVVAAGDEEPDIKMMRPGLARHVICPENASEKVKAHVLEMGGEVGRGECAEGVIDAFARLALKKGWRGK